jgi:hypothetical protein
MCKHREIVFRERFCGGCDRAFYICCHCDRGHRYCSDGCRQNVRRQQCRQANRKHQQSPEGKLDHRDRQRVYRDRRIQVRVTDQSSLPNLVLTTSPPLPIRWLRTIEIRHVVCIICGRSGPWMSTYRQREEMRPRWIIRPTFRRY